MATRHHALVLLVVLLMSEACSPTAPTGPLTAPVQPPGTGVPAGRLAIEDLSVRPVFTNNGEVTSYEPWLTLRETTGVAAVSISSIIVTFHNTDSETRLSTPSCIYRPGVDAGGSWNFDSVSRGCLTPLARSLSAFSVEIAYADGAGLAGYVAGTWQPSPGQSPPSAAATPAGRLVIEKLTTISGHWPNNPLWYEASFSLREVTGVAGVFIQSIVMRTDEGPYGTTMLWEQAGCIPRNRVEPGDSWSFDSIYIYCREPTLGPPTPFTITVNYHDSEGRRAIVRESWPAAGR